MFTMSRYAKSNDTHTVIDLGEMHVKIPSDKFIRNQIQVEIE